MSMFIVFVVQEFTQSTVRQFFIYLFIFTAARGSGLYWKPQIMSDCVPREIFPKEKAAQTTAFINLGLEILEHYF